jgi:hypothetical protein
MKMDKVAPPDARRSGKEVVLEYTYISLEPGKRPNDNDIGDSHSLADR